MSKEETTRKSRIPTNEKGEKLCRCGNVRQWLTKKDTNERYQWQYCEACERGRQQLKALKRKGQGNLIIPQTPVSIAEAMTPEQPAQNPLWREKAIAEMWAPVFPTQKTHDALVNAGCKTLGEAYDLLIEEDTKVKGVGKKTVEAIRNLA